MVARLSPKQLVRVQILEFLLNSVSLIDRIGEYESSDTGAIPVPSAKSP